MKDFTVGDSMMYKILLKGDCRFSMTFVALNRDMLAGFEISSNLRQFGARRRNRPKVPTVTNEPQ